MNNPTVSPTAEKVSEQTPEKILNFLRQEAIAQGIAPVRVDQFILANRERLNVNPDVVKLIEAEPQEAIETKEVAKGEVKEAKREKVPELDVKKEMEGVKMEIAESEREMKGVETSAIEEKRTVEQGDLDTHGGIKTSFKLDGYQPSAQIVSNSKSIAFHGDIKKAETWQALLVQRLQEIWGSIQKFFATDTAK